MERVEDVSLVVLPGVLNPVVFRTGEILARAVAELAFAKPPGGQNDETPDLALDMGTGSGIGAIFAARRGYRVIAVDVDPSAVRCARINTLLSQMDSRIEIREGDLFASVDGERFHLVTFNPPFLRGAARGLYGSSWWSTDVMDRFAAGLPTVLAPKGRALLLLSTQGDEDGMLAALARQQLYSAPLVRKNLGNEVITVYGVRRGASAVEGAS
jgi:methylase of polypeptide subunit release factors